MEEEQRILRATNLLFSIVLTFLVSWIPLNTLNLISDWMYLNEDTIFSYDKAGYSFKVVDDDIGRYLEVKYFYLLFSCCHLTAMSCTGEK